MKTKDDVAVVILFAIIIAALAGVLCVMVSHEAVPSETSMAEDASLQKQRIESLIDRCSKDEAALRLLVNKPKLSADDLTSAGDLLRCVKANLDEIRSRIASVTELASLLSVSDNVDSRLQGAGYQAFAHDATTTLQAFEQRRSHFEGSLGKLVGK